MSYVTCLHYFQWRKKKVKSYIIPASYFKSKGVTPVKLNLPTANKSEIQQPYIEKELYSSKINETESSEEIELENETIEEEISKPIINLKKEKKTSGLSLSSIKKKKEHLIKQMEVVLEEENLPEEIFKEKDLIIEWNNFIKLTEEKGLYNYASILSMDIPKLRDQNTILIELPNKTNKVELERSKNDLLIHLRKKLNNYSINLEITVNEELEKKFVYTPREKFEKMNEKNPNMKLLKKTFDLDL